MFEFSDLTIRFPANHGGEKLKPTILVSEEMVALCRRFRTSLLDAQENFHDTIRLPQLSPVNVEWIGIGLTAGVAIWSVSDKIDAASILLNGMETDGDRRAIQALFDGSDWPLPPSVWDAIQGETPPLVTTIHYNDRSHANRTTVTAAACLANTFFAIFGTSGECCGPRSKC